MSERTRAVVAAATGATWSYVILDFLMHAVILAPWWRATGGFWLPPLDMARRIPFAYGGFAIYCVSLTVLLTVVHGEEPPVLAGVRLGALVGIVFGFTSALGAYSVVRMPPSFLLVGPASTAIGSAGAAAAAAWVLRGGRRWRRVGVLLAAGLALFVGGVVAQNALSLPRVGEAKRAQDAAAPSRPFPEARPGTRRASRRHTGLSAQSSKML
jgi:hypothetical protein